MARLPSAALRQGDAAANAEISHQWQSDGDGFIIKNRTTEPFPPEATALKIMFFGAKAQTKVNLTIEDKRAVISAGIDEITTVNYPHHWLLSTSGRRLWRDAAFW